MSRTWGELSRDEKFDSVVAMLKSGHAYTEIGDNFGVARGTVRHFVERHIRGKVQITLPTLHMSFGKVVKRAHRMGSMPSDTMRADEPEHLGKTVAEVSSHECRWPRRKDGVTTFCGQHVQLGSSYCKHHHARCWYPRGK